MNKLIADIIETPLGKMLAVADDNFLYQLSFYQETNKTLPKQTQYLSNSIIILLKKELDLYFCGSLQCFSVPIKQIGTDFEKLAWRCLSTILYEKPFTYKGASNRHFATKILQGGCQCQC
jgi:O6-methylguanine-DNA--protein-cysteine methyltransferase